MAMGGRRLGVGSASMRLLDIIMQHHCGSGTGQQESWLRALSRLQGQKSFALLMFQWNGQQETLEEWGEGQTGGGSPLEKW